MLRTVLFANTLLFVVAMVTYPGLFVINPFMAGFTVMSIVQALSLFGLLLAIALPFWVRDGRLKAPRFQVLFLVSVLLWPLSILVIRALLFVGSGDWGFVYLLNFPIFAFTDYLLPGLAIVSFFRLLRDRKSDVPNVKVVQNSPSGSNYSQAHTGDFPA